MKLDARQTGAANGVLLSIVVLAVILVAGYLYLNSGGASDPAAAATGFVAVQVPGAQPDREEAATPTAQDPEELAVQTQLRYDRNGQAVYRSPQKFIATTAGGNKLAVTAELRVSGHSLKEASDPQAMGMMRRSVTQVPKLKKVGDGFVVDRPWKNKAKDGSAPATSPEDPNGGK